MNLSRNSGPFLKSEFIPDKRIERIALEELEKTGLMPDRPGPVSVDLFADYKWGAPEDYEDLPEGVLGYTEFTINGFQRIVLNRILDEDFSVNTRRRRRSTIAHECGHGVLHERLYIEKMMFDRDQRLLFGEMERTTAPRPEVEQTEARRIVSRERDVFGPQRGSPWWEIQANRFMVAMLMPKPLFYQVVEPLLLEFDMEHATQAQRTSYTAVH